jgi:hypothetical protein
VRLRAPSASRSRMTGKRRAARGLDAVVGFVLGEAEDIPAVDEEGGMALAEVDVAGVELGEVGDDVDDGVALADGEGLEGGHELGIGEAPQGSEEFVRHACVLPRASDGMGPHRATESVSPPSGKKRYSRQQLVLERVDG